MKPHKIPYDPQGELFKTELVCIIDMNHLLVLPDAGADAYLLHLR